VIPVAAVSQSLVTRVGVRPVLTIGLALITAGMAFYAFIPVHGSFVSALLPGYLLIGVGMAFAFIPVSIAALAGVEHHESGLASGLINTSQQIGGALGVAVASSIAFTHVKTLLASHHTPAEALTGGFSRAFWVLAAVSAVSVVASFALVRSREISLGEAEAAQAF
jgi:MFS family permease